MPLATFIVATASTPWRLGPLTVLVPVPVLGPVAMVTGRALPVLWDVPLPAAAAGRVTCAAPVPDRVPSVAALVADHVRMGVLIPVPALVLGAFAVVRFFLF